MTVNNDYVRCNGLSDPEHRARLDLAMSLPLDLSTGDGREFDILEWKPEAVVGSMATATIKVRIRIPDKTTRPLADRVRDVEQKLEQREDYEREQRECT